ncbi:MAG TPA: hypothetical protein VEX36_06730 [Thermoleophilaceae bacterium]|nr:hypothetical protein [Thermoleophilaceae bacterium]
MRNSNALRTFVCALLALMAVLVAPTVAGASSGQLSLIQDDAEMFGERSGEDPAAAMREMKDLGVDVLRTNVLFYRVYTRINDRVKPAGFDTSDPSEPLYNWSATDRIVSLARANGIKLLFTVSGPGPHWASEQPSRCRFNRICTWKPKPAEFGAFTAAVAKRYRGQVDWYALYNEPNLYTWITPEITRTKFGRVETGGVYYRKLWSAGYKAIRSYDPSRRGRVLFGEVAAISAPLPMLYASLCLGPDGKPFRGRLRSLHGCGGRPAKLNIGGWAIHPYNQGGFGPPSRRTSSKVALPQQYLPRLHRLMGQAAARGRVPGGRGIYITEFGYQTNPPDPGSTISPTRQGQYINESDRLFAGDRRIKTVAQYQLVDVRDPLQYNSGLRFAGGQKKPSYEAYRLPIVVTRRSARTVEVYGQVRPARQARRMGQFQKPELQFRRGGSFRTVARPSPNSVGIFRLNQSRAGAANGSWRIKWQNPLTGGVSYSRVAKAGQPLRYYRD